MGNPPPQIEVATGAWMKGIIFNVAEVTVSEEFGEDAWDAVVTVLSETLSSFEIDPSDIQQILSAVGSKKAFIVQSN